MKTNKNRYTAPESAEALPDDALDGVAEALPDDALDGVAGGKVTFEPIHKPDEPRGICPSVLKL